MNTERLHDFITRIALKQHANGYTPHLIRYHQDWYVTYGMEFREHIVEESTRIDTVFDALYRNQYRMHRHRLECVGVLLLNELEKQLQLFGLSMDLERWDNWYTMYSVGYRKMGTGFRENPMMYILEMDEH